MKKLTVSIFVVFLLVVMSGCSVLKPKAEAPAPTTAPIAAKTETPAMPTTAPPTPEPAIAVTGVETAEPVVITHVTVPGEPKYLTEQKVEDCSTGERKAMGVTTLIGVGCDDWNRNIARLERPADAPNGTYFPAADIVSSTMGTNQVWMFGKINLYKDAAGNLPAGLIIGFEIDINIDSRGDYLLLVTGLNSTEWTTDGVQVWRDQNDDVGGEKPQAPDGRLGDGYETLLFDAGMGLDPDLAWARINPADGASVEFAFKPIILSHDQKFAWWAWTALGGLDPAGMEIVDSLQNSAAWKFDNTCGWIFNGKPSNLLTNICKIIVPTATPVPTSTPKFIGCVTKTDAQCNAEANPQQGGFPWWWDAVNCRCMPTN
ncbi:MAG: Uncharacterized protein FD147_2339 [Chloroflexi bacterium]|nr:MAG: Uncharacterized protein FD147_2339 [Chloroflexota bacterium]